MPTARKCPICGFEAEDPKIRFCPEHGQKLEAPQDEVRFFDAFISYRREGGDDRASLIASALRNPHELNVFLDTDGLQPAEKYPQRLEEIIRRTPNFILVLTPGSLERCQNNGDWLRREIATALRAGRTIIPVTDKRFVWPKAEDLPEEIRVLPEINATPYDHQFRDASVDKIVAIVRKNLGERAGSPRAAKEPVAQAGLALAENETHARPATGAVRSGGHEAATSLSKKAEPPAVPTPGQNWTVPGVGIEMIWIEPGSFVMGSPEGETGRSDDETQHRVTLTKGFWLGKYPVTQRQWQELMGSNPSFFVTGKVMRKAGWFTSESIMPDSSMHPVEQVTWDDCSELCAQLTEIECRGNRLPHDYKYVLPTEAQWEYACRAGSASPYSGARDLGELAWFELNSGNRTHPVGTKKPNAWGLYDMHGNTYEWCLDAKREFSRAAVVDPCGPILGEEHIRRGGGWSCRSSRCRAAYRDGFFLNFRFYFGCRVALSQVHPNAHHFPSDIT